MEALLARAAALPYDFPPGTEAVQLFRVPPEQRERVARMASQVTPICDASVRDLLRGFLAQKRSSRGSARERALYGPMDEAELFTRLLCQRPLSFWGTGDRYILPTTTAKRQLSSRQWGGFENIGSDAQQEPLVLDRYLSYHEMQLSALVSVAVPTLFINDGGRGSACKPGAAGSFQESGVLVACVGARMVKGRLMEAEHMLVTPECTATRGYGPQAAPHGGFSAWARLYGVGHLPCYDEAVAAHDAGRYHIIKTQCSQCKGMQDEVWTEQGCTYCRACMEEYYGSSPDHPPDSASFLDGLVYKRRIRLTVEPFLVFASDLGSAHRASIGHGAHVRVKGLGLGAWWVDPVQEVLMKEVYEEVMQARALPGIDVLEFAYFPSEDLPRAIAGVEVRASRCGFAEPVGERLLVAMYAWDGNSHPGNEWWAEDGSGRYLGMTDDSAAASCSLITSLQHPGINAERLSSAAARLLSEDGVFREFSPA